MSKRGVISCVVEKGCFHDQCIYKCINSLSVSYYIFPTGIVALGAHESILVIRISQVINLLVLIFIIVTGFVKGDLHNWKLTEQDYKLNTSGSRDIYGLGG